MSEKTHDCQHHGHVWLETDGTPYVRHRGRSDASVSVVCQFCKAPNDLPRHSGFSGKRSPGQPIDKRIPPQFKAVLDRALTEAPKSTGPVPKTP